MERKFRYDAFISYRHSEPDRFVAENLHKRLEAFRLPHSVAKKRKDKSNKIERVFRDKEELPLSSNLEDPIVQALESSEWLIVICTPRLKDSLWCKKEIETFIKLHGREHVLAVLAEGEPAESFPEELLYRVEEHTLEDGSVEEIKVPVEPLAADMRGRNKKEILKAMKTEILRLLAAMFELPYDDLKQRHRERRMRRILAATALGGAVCLLFGIYSTATALRIQKQKEQIEAQSEEILAQSEAIQAQSEAIQAQSEEIKQQSEEIAKQNEELTYKQALTLAEQAERYLAEGDRNRAVAVAVEALTESDGIEMPYTSQAHLVLAECVRAYDTGNSFKAGYQLELKGRIASIEQSADGDTLIIYDDTDTLTLFDLEQAEIIRSFENAEMLGVYTFFQDDYFLYIEEKEDSQAKLVVYDLETGEEVKRLERENDISKLYTDEAGTYLLGKVGYGTIGLLDTNTFECMAVTPELGGGIYPGSVYVFEEGILSFIINESADMFNPEFVLYFVNLDTMEVVSNISLGRREQINLEVREGVAYMAQALYDGDFSHCDSYALAVEIESGRILWEQEFPGYFARDIQLPAYEEAKDLLFVTSGNVTFIDMETGEVVLTSTTSDTPLVTKALPNTEGYSFICEDGKMLTLTLAYGSTLDMTRYFECATTNNSNILWTKYGIVVQVWSDRKFTVYTMEPGPDMISAHKEIDFPSQEFSLAESIQIARNYNLEDPEYVISAFYSDDSKYCYITYWDDSLVIYDVEKKVICNTLKNGNNVYFYAGKDTEGYSYLLGTSGCYVLNDKMEPVTWILHAREVDIPNKKVYIEWSSNLGYETPLYTLEQLLEMGQNYKK